MINRKYVRNMTYQSLMEDNLEFFGMLYDEVTSAAYNGLFQVTVDVGPQTNLDEELHILRNYLEYKCSYDKDEGKLTLYWGD